MALNALGRDIPEFIPGYGKTKLFRGAFALTPDCPCAGPKLRVTNPDRTSKVLPDIKAAIAASGLKSGMTISFHHHMRNGDFVVNQVIDA